MTDIYTSMFADFPIVTTVEERRQRASRPHICTICGQPIATGVKYIRLAYIDHDAANHPFRVVKTHIVCDPAA